MCEFTRGGDHRIKIAGKRKYLCRVRSNSAGSFTAIVNYATKRDGARERGNRKERDRYISEMYGKEVSGACGGVPRPR